MLLYQPGELHESIPESVSKSFVPKCARNVGALNLCNREEQNSAFLYGKKGVHRETLDRDTLLQEACQNELT